MLLLLSIGLNKEEIEEIREIYYKYRYIMKNIALRYVNESNADDIVQEAFFRIRKNLLKIISLPCKEKRSYIVNIVKSVCLDYLRKDKRYRREIELCRNDPLYNKFDNMFERESMRISIERVFYQMNDKNLIPLILKYYCGYTTKEICNKLNIESENTVSSMIHRGKREFINIYIREIEKAE